MVGMITLKINQTLRKLFLNLIHIQLANNFLHDGKDSKFLKTWVVGVDFTKMVTKPQ